jgi:hypothetical protein
MVLNSTDFRLTRLHKRAKLITASLPAVVRVRTVAMSAGAVLAITVPPEIHTTHLTKQHLLFRTPTAHLAKTHTTHLTNHHLIFRLIGARAISTRICTRGCRS